MRKRSGGPVWWGVGHKSRFRGLGGGLVCGCIAEGKTHRKKSKQVTTAILRRQVLEIE